MGIGCHALHHSGIPLHSSTDFFYPLMRHSTAPLPFRSCTLALYPYYTCEPRNLRVAWVAVFNAKQEPVGRQIREQCHVHELLSQLLPLRLPWQEQLPMRHPLAKPRSIPGQLDLIQVEFPDQLHALHEEEG